ncbi:MAG TPA: non-heme iron oxygenase ferredoxin subunit [Gammaproteobacteria bacterium]|nr:non-heme iron oxygenase ferredoxin subunit [Gammaproteobacteria bacterium]
MAIHYIHAANRSDILPGKMLRIKAGSKAILVTNIDGAFFAVDDMCTHEDASLYLGCIKGDLVQCSLHGGTFNVKTGAAVDEPAEIPLQTYPVKYEGEAIYVGIEEDKKMI